MPNLKQGTLSFASAKRTNSVPNGKLQKRITVTEKGKNEREEISLEALNNAQFGKAIEISSDEEGSAASEIIVPVKRSRPSTKTRSSAPPQPSQSEKQKPSTERERLDVEDRAGRYRKYHNEVRSKMGHIPPIHSEGQNRIHQMLRFFDMSYEFGPCIGMTRLERWERAEAFGLNPPVEVRDILLTKEGVENAEYAQCVLHDEV